MTRLAILALTLATAAAAACRPDAEDHAMPPAETPPAGAAAAALSDAEVAHITVTANEIDAELGQLALQRSEDPDVRGFAQRMVTEHRAVNEQAAALAGRLGVTPADNEVSQSLRADAVAVRQRLEGLEGTEFNRAYIQREVRYHEQVLDAIDGVLLPSASNAELRDLIEQVRPAIAAHLDHARSLQRQVAVAN